VIDEAFEDETLKLKGRALICGERYHWQLIGAYSLLYYLGYVGSEGNMEKQE